jgi:hypothetical protein
MNLASYYVTNGLTKKQDLQEKVLLDSETERLTTPLSIQVMGKCDTISLRKGSDSFRDTVTSTEMKNLVD